jgi:hypothetical protein
MFDFDQVLTTYDDDVYEDDNNDLGNDNYDDGDDNAIHV